MGKQNRDTSQIVGINTVLLEDTIDLRTVTRKFTSQPTYASLLLFEFLLDKTTNRFHTI